MPLNRHLTHVILVAALSLAWPACATRVIILPVDGDAGGTSGGGGAGTSGRYPGPFCIPFTDQATGEACKACYDDTGTQTKRDCVASTMGMMCGIVEDPMQGHCVQCTPSMGTMTAIRACLKCTSAQEGCEVCSWSDQPTDKCMLCKSPDTGALTDSCDQLRPEL